MAADQLEHQQRHLKGTCQCVKGDGGRGDIKNQWTSRGAMAAERNWRKTEIKKEGEKK